jgi:hypothetical protein
MLALLDTGGGSHFLPLGDGRFLALTESFAPAGSARHRRPRGPHATLPPRTNAASTTSILYGSTPTNARAERVAAFQAGTGGG